VDNWLTHPLGYKWTPIRPVSTDSHDVLQVAEMQWTGFKKICTSGYLNISKGLVSLERDRTISHPLTAGVESPNTTLPKLFPGCRRPSAGYPDVLDTGLWQLVPSSLHCLWQALLQSLWMLYQPLLVSFHTHSENACFSDCQPGLRPFLPS